MVKIKIPGLNRPFLAYSAYFQFLHIQQLLEVSERELEAQHQAGLEKAKQSEIDEFAQWEIQNAEKSYESLALLLRYGMLVALVTAVDWQAKKLKESKKVRFPTKPQGKGEAVHILETFRSVAKLAGEKEIAAIERLIHVRNLVAHAHGRPHDYEYPDILVTIGKLAGFGVGSKFDYVGETLTIQRDALVPYLDMLKEFMPNFIDSLKKRDLVKLQ